MSREAGREIELAIISLANAVKRHSFGRVLTITLDPRAFDAFASIHCAVIAGMVRVIDDPHGGPMEHKLLLMVGGDSIYVVRG